MSRGVKQLVYGVLYLFILFSIGRWLYGATVKPAPTCFDSVQNQNETGVDCGGPCVSCAIKSLQPLRASGAVQVLRTGSGVVALLGDVVNANETFNAYPFTYIFTVYGQGGKVLKSISGSANISALQERYLYEVVGDVQGEQIERADLTFSGVPDWQPAAAIGIPRASLTNTTTTFANGAVQVNGLVQNQGAVSIVSVSILAIIYDRFGSALFAAQTVLQNVPPGDSKPFVIAFPKDADLVRNTVPIQTQISVYAE